MAREGTFFGYLKNNDVLTVPLYNLESAGIFITRLDNIATDGTVLVRTVIPKTYNYDSYVLYADAPLAFYGFPLVQQIGRIPLLSAVLPLSTVTVPKETVNGRTCVLSGGNLVAGNYTVSRLSTLYAYVPPTVQVQDTFIGISANDNVGAVWSIDGWIYRTANTIQTVYLESNAGFTSYLQVFTDATGKLNIAHSGVTAYTSTQTILLNTWMHFGLVYNGTQIISYLNGSAAAAIAYTHGTYTGISLNRINHNPGNVLFIQSLACYGTALDASVMNRHYQNIAGNDFEVGVSYQPTTGIGQNGGGHILFSNTHKPFDSINPSGNNFGVVLPLVGVAYIQPSNTANGSVWFYALQTFEKEGVE